MTAPIQPDEFPLRSGRLWSLLEMLTLKARFFVLLGEAFKNLEDRFYSGERTRDLTGEELGAIQTHFERVLGLCHSLRLTTSEELLRTRTDHATLPRSQEGFAMLRDAVYAELNDVYFTYVPSERIKYFDGGDRFPYRPIKERKGIVSTEAQDAFPQAYEEIRSAGTCYALALPVAAVFHAMRAAEIGLRALVFDMNLTLPHPVEQMDWMPLINAIGGKVRDIENQPKSAQRDADLAFYSEAAAQLRFFKNAWRNRVSHVRAAYTDEQAREVVDHVRAFFEVLKARLQEPPP